MTVEAQSVISPSSYRLRFLHLGTIGDIGGAWTFAFRAVLKSAPKLRGCLLSKPMSSSVWACDETIANRLSCKAATSFRGPLPRCDAYVLIWRCCTIGPMSNRGRFSSRSEAAPDKAKLLVWSRPFCLMKARGQRATASTSATISIIQHVVLPATRAHPR